MYSVDSMKYICIYIHYHTWALRKKRQKVHLNERNRTEA